MTQEGNNAVVNGGCNPANGGFKVPHHESWLPKNDQWIFFLSPTLQSGEHASAYDVLVCFRGRTYQRLVSEPKANENVKYF